MKKILFNLTMATRKLGELLPEALLALCARLAVATVFWNAAQTKFSGGQFLEQSWQFWNVSQSTFFLFQHEYNVPLIPHKMAAYMATSAEFFLSIAIAIGLFTRLSALGLLAMTAVIQIFVYPNAWPTHILWATGLLYLIKHGAGKVSLDALLARS